MRVAINLLGLPSIRQGGAGISARTLLEGLAREPGVEVRLLCDSVVADELAELQGSVDIRAVRRSRRPAPVRWLEFASALADPRRYSDGYSPPSDALAGCQLLHYPLSFVAPPPHRLPTVMTFVDLQHRAFPQFFSVRDRLMRRLRMERPVSGARAVIAISEFTKRSLVETLSADPAKIHVVPLACDARFFRAPAADGREDFFFYPAAPLPSKNHERLLDAFGEVARRHPSVQLVLSGPALHDWSAVERAVGERGLNERVEISGTLRDEELAERYARARALVFPSLYEGFGLPVAEAMASGCLVLASNAASVPEVAGQGALIFDPRDVAAIEEAMERALSLSPAETATLVEKGRSEAERFRPERFVAQTLEVYERVRAGQA